MDVENQRLLFHGKDYTPTALQNNLAFFYKDFKPIGFIPQLRNFLGSHLQILVYHYFNKNVSYLNSAELRIK
jgi:hypothetical protein